MGREIKFRAWHIIGNNIVNGEEWGMSFSEDENCCSWDTITSDNGTIVMQYTGLKDKNGKEIYEGDIIHIKTGRKPDIFDIPQEQTTDVYYDRGAFRYRHSDGSGSVIDFKSTKIVEGYELITQDVIIIGNIYENKDLLEK